MDARIERFRKVIVPARQGNRFGPYPPEAKRLAVEIARPRLAEGEPMMAIAAELGISNTTLDAWLKQGGESPLRPVSLVEPVAGALGRGRGGLVVVLPGGMRIEGLDLEGAVELARALS